MHEKTVLPLAFCITAHTDTFDADFDSVDIEEVDLCISEDAAASTESDDESYSLASSVTIPARKSTLFLEKNYHSSAHEAP